MAFSHSGRRIALGGADKVEEFEVNNSALLHSIVLDQRSIPSAALSYSPDDSMIVTSRNDELHPLRVTDRKELASKADIPVAWDPKGRFIAFAAKDNEVHLWNPFAQRKDEDEIVLQVRNLVRGIGVSEAGTQLAIANGNFVTVFKFGQ